MKELLKSLNQKPIVVYPIYNILLGNASYSIFLSQILYWLSVSATDEIWKTERTLQKETCLSDWVIRNAKKIIPGRAPFLQVRSTEQKTFYSIDWNLYAVILRAVACLIKEREVNYLLSKEGQKEVQKIVQEVTKEYKTRFSQKIKQTEIEKASPLENPSRFVEETLHMLSLVTTEEQIASLVSGENFPAIPENSSGGGEKFSGGGEKSSPPSVKSSSNKNKENKKENKEENTYTDREKESDNIKDLENSKKSSFILTQTV